MSLASRLLYDTFDRPWRPWQWSAWPWHSCPSLFCALAATLRLSLLYLTVYVLFIIFVVMNYYSLVSSMLNVCVCDVIYTTLATSEIQGGPKVLSWSSSVCLSLEHQCLGGLALTVFVMILKTKTLQYTLASLMRCITHDSLSLAVGWWADIWLLSLPSFILVTSVI